MPCSRERFVSFDDPVDVRERSPRTSVSFDVLVSPPPPGSPRHQYAAILDYSLLPPADPSAPAPDPVLSFNGGQAARSAAQLAGSVICLWPGLPERARQVWTLNVGRLWPGQRRTQPRRHSPMRLPPSGSKQASCRLPAAVMLAQLGSGRVQQGNVGVQCKNNKRAKESLKVSKIYI